MPEQPLFYRNPGQGQTFEQGAYPSPSGDGSLSIELAEGQFHVEEGHSGEEDHDGVGDEEGPAAILETQIGKSPDIAEVDGEADDRKEKVHLETGLGGEKGGKKPWWTRSRVLLP